MKSYPQFRCRCGYVLAAEVTGTQPLQDTMCPKCKAAMWFVDDGIASNRIFARATSELQQQQDYTLAIILSAMAVEAELARVFIKWKEMELMGEPMRTDDESKWEDQLRRWSSITEKFDGICTFLARQHFDAFLANRPELLETVCSRHPALRGNPSPKAFFQEQLFWKRNRIIHFGAIDFSGADAYQCVELASTLFLIIREIDAVRVKRLEMVLATASRKVQS